MTKPWDETTKPRPWLEHWAPHYNHLTSSAEYGSHEGGWIKVAPSGSSPDPGPACVWNDTANAHLIAAAPAMARLLCRLEWTSVQDETGCVVCGEFADDDVPEHTADCLLDAALTAAGLDAEERERVRGGK